MKKNKFLKVICILVLVFFIRIGSVYAWDLGSCKITGLSGCSTTKTEGGIKYCYLGEAKSWLTPTFECDDIAVAPVHKVYWQLDYNGYEYTDALEIELGVGSYTIPVINKTVDFEAFNLSEDSVGKSWGKMAGVQGWVHSGYHITPSDNVNLKLTYQDKTITYRIITDEDSGKALCTKIEILDEDKKISDKVLISKSGAKSSDKLYVSTSNGCSKSNKVIWYVRKWNGSKTSNTSLAELVSADTEIGTNAYAKYGTVVWSYAGTKNNFWADEITANDNVVVTACLYDNNTVDTSKCDSILLVTKNVSDDCDDQIHIYKNGSKTYIACCPDGLTAPKAGSGYISSTDGYTFVEGKSTPVCIDDIGGGSYDERSLKSNTEVNISYVEDADGSKIVQARTSTTYGGDIEKSVNSSGLTVTDPVTGEATMGGVEVPEGGFYDDSDGGDGYTVSSGVTVTDPQKTYNYDEIDVCTVKHVIDVCKIFARIIAIFKILTPVILVIVSTKSLAEAMLDENETDLKKYTRVFIQRFILGIFVFFLPTLLTYLLSFTTKNGYKNVFNKYKNCINCVLDIDDCPSDSELMVPQENENGTTVTDTYVSYTGSQEAEDCNSLLGNPIDANDIAYYVQLTFNIMKIVGIALCIVFSIVDIVKAILGGDKDMYKPVVGKIIKRLVYVAVLLFLPEIVDVLMTATGMYSSCNIT